jgi:uncharacterized protein (TIGR00106 family)
MSVLVDLSIFPVNAGEHLSIHVAPVVAMIAASGHPYTLTAMGTLIETPAVDEALALVARAHALLADAGCRRIYATIKLDSRDGPVDRLHSKTASVQARLDDPVEPSGGLRPNTESPSATQELDP